MFVQMKLVGGRIRTEEDALLEQILEGQEKLLAAQAATQEALQSVASDASVLAWGIILTVLGFGLLFLVLFLSADVRRAREAITEETKKTRQAIAEQAESMRQSVARTEAGLSKMIVTADETIQRVIGEKVATATQTLEIDNRATRRLALYLSTASGQLQLGSDELAELNKKYDLRFPDEDGKESPWKFF